MRRLTMQSTTAPRRWVGSCLFFAALCLSGPPAQAADQPGPWECSNYQGDAHARCLQAFIEIQRDKISKLEAEVQRHQSTVGQLKEQVDRQNAVSVDLQRQMNERPTMTAPVMPYYNSAFNYPLYSYPSFGFGLYLGRPWGYGAHFYGRPYGWGPRFYRPYYFGRGFRRW